MGGGSFKKQETTKKISQSIKQKIQIHYYFNDESHSMDAFVRNKAEKDLIEALKRIGEILDEEIKIECEATEKGTLIETLAILIPVLHYLSPSINAILTHHFTKNSKIEKLDEKIKEKTLENLKITNESLKFELEQKLEKSLKDKLVARHVSNYYKQMEAYKKVQKIGFKSIDKNSEEHIVERKNFKDFILSDNTTMTEDPEAVIEIISPVLKEGRYKWRGKYLGEGIEFSMGDPKFKKDVVSGGYSFANGSLMYCYLRISVTYDDFGDERKRSYSVQKVFGTKKQGMREFMLRKIGLHKKSKEMEEKQCTLFENEKKENE